MKKEHSIDTEIPMGELLSLKPGWQQPNMFETLIEESNMRRERNVIGARLLPAIQASDRPVQLEEQRKWIENLWQKIGADDVFKPYTEEEATIVKEISAILLSYIDGRMPEFAPSGAKNQFATKIAHMKAQKLLDNIYLTALKLGLFEESGDVHIYDICAQDGIAGIVIAALRDGIPENGVTSTLESETNQLEGQNFLFIDSFFGTKLSRFAYGDSDGLKFKNHPERKTYWIANGPPIFKTLMEDIAKMDQADSPEESHL